MAIPAERNPDRCPAHPGDILADLLKDLPLSKAAVARMLGISRQQFHAILAGRKPVSPDTAARLGKFFGDGPAIWLRHQAAYDAWHAAREVDVSAVPSLQDVA